MNRSRSLAALTVSILVSGAVLAAPAVSVVPASIDRFASSAVEVSATGIAGSAMILRLIVDVDRDGLADPGDYAAWTDVVPDNATEWSPLMLADTDGLPGTITVHPQLFTPFAFPHAVGHYLWEVEDPADGSRGSAPFVVTQATETQAVAGRVTTTGGAPLPGALVALIPVGKACADADLSAIADANGNYAIEFPAALPCTHRAVAAVMPGHFGDLIHLPAIQFTGADRFTGIDAVLPPGPHAVTGRVAYASGPRAGEGIPGLVLFAESGTTFEIAFTGADGSYALGLATGTWSIRADSDLHVAAQGAVTERDAAATLNVTGPLAAADISYPAASAFIAGRLLDDATNGHAAEEIRAYVEGPCAPCYETRAFTQADGSYTVGVVGPPSPATSGWYLEPERPLEGLVAQEIHVAVSEGETVAGADLEHLTPTSFIHGRITDPSGLPLGDLCLGATSSGPARHISRGRAACDGTYSIPVVDGSWSVRYDEDVLVGVYRGLDVTQVEWPVQVAGEEVLDANLILGPWLAAPRLVSIDRPAAQAGAHVVLFGYNFSASGASPIVKFNGVQATVVAYRPAIGRVAVVVPAGLAPGVVQVAVTDPSLGTATNELCFEVLPGSFVPACTISGNLTRNGSTPVQNALVAVLDGTTQRFVRGGVSDAAGHYAVTLDDPGGSYALLLIPPSNPRRVWGFYGGVSCPATQNHDFFGGRDIDGQVVDEHGQGVPNVTVEAEGSLASSEKITDADGRFNVRMRVPDTVRLQFFAPDGSRYLNTVPPIEFTVTDNTVLPPVTLQTGALFAGRVVDRDAIGVEARIEARERSTGVPSGIARSAECDGRFTLATWPGEHVLYIGPEFGESPAEVQWLGVTADTLAEFDFTVLDDAPLQLTGTGPRIADDSDAIGAGGQPVALQVENLTPTDVEVLFTAAGGGTVPGDETGWDTARGLLATRVPANAVSGDVVVRVLGVDSPPLPFLVPGTGWDPGAYSLSGTVTDGMAPVPGATIALLRQDPNDPSCEPADQLQDYAVSDAAGAYALNHPGGDFFLAVIPPAATTLAPVFLALQGESGDHPGLDVTLPPGESLSLRVVAGSPPAPVPGAVVRAEGDAFDWRVTDANGEALLHLPAGPTRIEVVAPYDSRLLTQQIEAVAPGALGDVALVVGVFSSGRVVDAAGVPVAGATAEAARQGPYPRFFATLARGNGIWRGPVDVGAPYYLNLRSGRPDLGDVAHNVSDGQARDRIAYPSDVLRPAGFVAGTVRDAASLTPIPFASLATVFDEGGTLGNFSTFGQTCDDGTYRMKVPEGSHYLQAFGAGDLLPGWYSPESEGDYCALDAESFYVEAGETVTNVDVDLDLRSSVSGTVWLYNDLVPGVPVAISGGRLGTCPAGAWTGGGGWYSTEVPAGPDYRVEASSPPGFYGPSQCWERVNGCATFTPLTATPISGTSGVDFVFGYPPSEVSGGPVQLAAERTPEGMIRLTFEQLPPEQHADVYNVYGGTLGVFDVASRTDCFLSPFGLQDNGDGTYSYFLSPGEGSEWYLIGASNVVGESSLGPGTALSNACGALPIDD